MDPKKSFLEEYFPLITEQPCYDEKGKIIDLNQIRKKILICDAIRYWRIAEAMRSCAGMIIINVGSDDDIENFVNNISGNYHKVAYIFNTDINFDLLPKGFTWKPEKEFPIFLWIEKIKHGMIKKIPLNVKKMWGSKIKCDEINDHLDEKSQKYSVNCLYKDFNHLKCHLNKR